MVFLGEQKGCIGKFPPAWCVIASAGVESENFREIAEVVFGSPHRIHRMMNSGA